MNAACEFQRVLLMRSRNSVNFATGYCAALTHADVVLPPGPSLAMLALLIGFRFLRSLLFARADGLCRPHLCSRVRMAGVLLSEFARPSRRFRVRCSRSLCSLLRCARATARRPVSASAVRGCRNIGVSFSSFLPTLSPVVVLGSYVTHVGANVSLFYARLPGNGSVTNLRTPVGCSWPFSRALCTRFGG